MYGLKHCAALCLPLVSKCPLFRPGCHKLQASWLYTSMADGCTCDPPPSPPPNPHAPCNPVFPVTFSTMTPRTLSMPLVFVSFQGRFLFSVRVGVSESGPRCAERLAANISSTAGAAPTQDSRTHR